MYTALKRMKNFETVTLTPKKTSRGRWLYGLLSQDVRHYSHYSYCRYFGHSGEYLEECSSVAVQSHISKLPGRPSLPGTVA